MSSWIPVIGALLFISCSEQSGRGNEQVEWRVVPNSHAHGFRILAWNDVRRLIVFGPGNERDTVGDILLDLDPNSHRGFGSSHALTVPLQRLAVVSTTHLSYLAALGGANAVVGCALREKVMDPAVLAQLPGTVRAIGSADGPDREQLIDLAPDALLDYPFGRTASWSTSLPGIPLIPVTEYLEDHPLGRAEWLRFFGVLLDKENEADSLFNWIRRRYEEARSRAGNGTSRPSVFIGSAWQGQWFVPGADSYMATLINDAGGQYVFSDRTGKENLPIDLETLVIRSREADHFGVLLDLQPPVNVMDLAAGDARIASFASLRDGGFYGNSGTDDLYGRALLEPEVVLQDLICIYRPESCPGYAPIYFRPLGQ